MARSIHRLTDVVIRRLTKPGLYSDGGGLYLRTRPTGTKSWIFRYRKDGKLHDLGLGPLHTIDLAGARRRARHLREQRFDGIDPLEAKKAGRITAKIEAAKAITFEACAKAYIAAHQAGWRNAKHAAQWPSSLSTFVYPVFGSLPVAAIDVGLVMKAIEPIWRTKTETASRLRGRIESVLDWATTSGYRQGENPARWKGHLENLLPRRSKVAPVRHHPALPYTEIGAFMAALRTQDGVAARALEFAIFTAARTGEVVGAVWDEIDINNRLWIIPGPRMKAGKEHRCPLSDAALAIIQTMATQRHGDFVFPGGKADRPLSAASLFMTLRRMQRDDLTTHGFRACFTDWCAEQTSFPAEVREMALAHTVGDKVEAAYRRGDLLKKRYQLADAWARFCLTAPQAGGVVVRLRSGA